MEQSERRTYLIRELLKENRKYRGIKIPVDIGEQKQLLRSLMNVRWAAPIRPEFEQVQDAYLQEENAARGIVTMEELKEQQPGLYLWQGDITRLQVGAIVNAANSGMTGCYRPCHNCIDNCIHTYAGIQLRNYCAEIMDRQGYEEPTGQAKITPAFNLPCEYVIHTVGPIVSPQGTSFASDGRLKKHHEEQLASCYRSCLEIADKNQVDSIAFCCISTGVFMFPNVRAAEIAVATVKAYKRQTGSKIKVVFNVFKDEDLRIYRRILTEEDGLQFT